MSNSPVIVCLPIADRQRSFEFYGAGLGFEPIGELAEDGLPEPLQFAVNDGIRLMLIPTGGFGWVIGGRKVADPGVGECILALSAGTNAEVDQQIDRAREAGADIVSPPAAQPWGYTATFADPDQHLWQVTTTP
ncbi:VOC family protein [Kribbella sp. NPDC023855]|uniref:VOC family protein n=1 Tax=Kribbella sp. NPDC023855 TaxID=3154698 RepID=UPI0033D1C8FA